MLNGYASPSNDYPSHNHYTMWMDQKIRVDDLYFTWIYKYELDNKQPISDSSYLTWANTRPY